MVIVASGLGLNSLLGAGDMAHARASVKLNIPAMVKNLLAQTSNPDVPGLIAPAQGFAIPGIANTPAFVKALIKKETGPYPDSFIFTLVDGDPDLIGKKTLAQQAKDGEMSSAFGPAQITYELAETIRDAQANKKLLNNSPEFKEYLTAIIKQGRKRINSFRDSETTPVPPNYIGGGKGNIPQVDHDKHYGRLIQLALEAKMRILTAKGKPFTVENMSGAWYAGKPKATEKFIEDVVGFYKENVRPYQELAKTGPRSTMYAPTSGLLNYVE